MISADVKFRRFVTLEKESPDVTYRAIGLENDVCDWFVPDDEWWLLHSVRWREVTIQSNLTSTGDIQYGFYVFRTVQFTPGSFDILRRPVGFDQLLFSKYIRYGIDYSSAMYGEIFAQPQLLPPRSRCTLMAQAYGTSLPAYTPSIHCPASIDVSIYTLSDDIGITGQGTIGAPVISEWWTQ